MILGPKILKNEIKTYFTVVVGQLVVTGGDKGRGSFFLSSNPDESGHRFYQEEDANFYANQLNGTVLKHTVHEVKTELIEEVTIE
ncbi:hypothetical protein [Sutcliffiella sp. FSL R7-0096]|uniref:hypothetical protein n=1 Tax=Sutcliffiella sp. FSL R7-0096 TaxID=2921670 RepID=UPI00315B3FD2